MAGMAWKPPPPTTGPETADTARCKLRKLHRAWCEYVRIMPVVPKLIIIIIPLASKPTFYVNILSGPI